MIVHGSGNVGSKFYDKWISLVVDGVEVRVDYDDVNHAAARNVANEIAKRLKDAPPYEGPPDGDQDAEDDSEDA